METIHAHKGYYCLIQYCPDPSRAEAVNLGVVLFCPDLPFLKTRMTQSNKRVERLFGPTAFDSELLNFGKKSLCNRIEAEAANFRQVADLEHFVNTRANEWRLTPPRPMRVTDPERQLKDLLGQLVEKPVRPAVIEEVEQPAVLRKLEAIFDKPSLRGRIQRDLSVTVPVVGRQLTAPYAYTNGRLNLIKPQKVGAGKLMRQVEVLAFEGGILLQRSAPSEGSPPRLVVIPYGDDTEAGREAEAKACEILGAADVPSYTCDNLEILEREVESQAH